MCLTAVQQQPWTEPHKWNIQITISSNREFEEWPTAARYLTYRLEAEVNSDPNGALGSFNWNSIKLDPLALRVEEILDQRQHILSTRRRWYWKACSLPARATGTTCLERSARHPRSLSRPGPKTAKHLKSILNLMSLILLNFLSLMHLFNPLSTWKEEIR